MQLSCRRCVHIMGAAVCVSAPCCLKRSTYLTLAAALLLSTLQPWRLSVRLCVPANTVLQHFSAFSVLPHNVECKKASRDRGSDRLHEYYARVCIERCALSVLTCTGWLPSCMLVMKTCFSTFHGSGCRC